MVRVWKILISVAVATLGLKVQSANKRDARVYVYKL